MPGRSTRITISNAPCVNPKCGLKQIWPDEQPNLTTTTTTLARLGYKPRDSVPITDTYDATHRLTFECLACHQIVVATTEGKLKRK